MFPKLVLLGRALGLRGIEFSTHDSEPCTRTGRIQHSIILHEERGVSKLWKAPSWSCRKKAAHAFWICSVTDFLLEGAESYQTHHGISLIFLTARQVLPIAMLGEGACFLLDAITAHFWAEARPPGLGEGISDKGLLNSILNIHECHQHELRPPHKEAIYT